MQMFLIHVYVPETHLEIVKAAMFQAGAGVIGLYSHCAWQIAGQGQFMPLEGSSPYVGATHQLERVIDYKLEMICSQDKLQDALAALRTTHPYEAMAYYVIPTETWLAREEKSPPTKLSSDSIF